MGSGYTDCMLGKNALKTTIVIPNYNGKEYLIPCLNSIFADEPSIKVLVVDNGSRDGSVEELQKYPQVDVIRFPENRGFCVAVNAGILAAETDYVILLNNDVVVEKGFSGALEKALDEHPKAFSVGAQMRMMKDPDYMDNAGDYYCALGWAYDYGKGRKVQDKYQHPRKVFAACGGAAIYRKSMLDEIGLFDENHFAYLEDVDIGYRARIFGYQNLYEPKALVYHAGSSVSGSKYNEFKTNLSSRNSIYLVMKNMPALQILVNLPFLCMGFLVKTIFFSRKKMGKLYVKGLAKGFQLSFSESGKNHKISFRWKHFPNYLLIQWELWVNLLRRFFG